MPPPKENNPLALDSDDFTKTVHSEPYPAIDSSKANLHGKSVFICGASKGIGRCIALSYAKAGASYIAIGARSDLTTVEKDVVEVARAVGKTTPKVLQVKVDVTNVESVGKAAHEIGKRFPQLDIVIYNAGVVGQMVPILDSDPDKWWNTWDINLRGAFLVTRAFLPVQLKGGDKQIAYTSSCGAWLALPGLSDYQPTKLALSRFTEFVGVEYGEQGIVAFSIHPGNVVTEIVGPDGPPEHLKHIFTETPDLCGDCLVYLTAEKRPWLSGRYINSIWDMPELVAKKDEIMKGDKLKAKMSF